MEATQRAATSFRRRLLRLDQGADGTGPALCGDFTVLSRKAPALRLRNAAGQVFCVCRWARSSFRVRYQHAATAVGGAASLLAGRLAQMTVAVLRLRTARTIWQLAASWRDAGLYV